MIKCVSREKIFKTSVAADCTIAGVQAAYAEGWDAADAQEAALLEKLYDHRVSYKSAEEREGELAVLALPANTKESFEDALPEQLGVFFQRLDIHELYLMDWLNRPWDEFPFESPAKKKSFHQLLQNWEFSGGFQVNVKQLRIALPPLLFSTRYGQPVWYLFPADTKNFLSLQLCDDNNLHISYPKKEQAVEKAAVEAGFEIGGLELCRLYPGNRWQSINP